MKRKRPVENVSHGREKRHKTSQADRRVFISTISHPVLSHVYPQVLTLRQYVLSKLPGASKGRRRRIQHAGLENDEEKELGHFLDRTLVGMANAIGEGETRRRGVELQAFTQELGSSTASDIDTTKLHQNEVSELMKEMLSKIK